MWGAEDPGLWREQPGPCQPALPSPVPGRHLRPQPQLHPLLNGAGRGGGLRSLPAPGSLPAATEEPPCCGPRRCCRRAIWWRRRPRGDGTRPIPQLPPPPRLLQPGRRPCPPPLRGLCGRAPEAAGDRPDAAHVGAEGRRGRAGKMLLSLVLHTYSMRYVLPAAVMLGTAPTYVLAWGAWRLLSALLPARFYWELDDRFYSIYQSMVLFFFERYTGVQVIIYGDLPKNKENVVCLSNHQSTVDWIVADMLAIRQNALGHIRYVLKDGLKWLPLYGWYFSQHGGIYVKRSAKFNEEEMRNKLQAQVKTETPVYLVIFPEGTRYDPEMRKVIADSQLFAEKEGLTVLKHVVTPRVKATHVAIDTMKNYLDAVYDVTIAYEGTMDHKGQRKVAPSMTEFLCKECPKVHIYLDRIELKDIPEEQMYMRRWLHERFEIKDKLLMEFYDAKDSKRRNKFPGKCVHSKLSLKKTLPSLLFLGGLTASMLLTEFGRKLYVNTWIYGTLIGYLWVSIKA